MAKLYFKVGSDVDRVIQLRQEISKLKQELMSMDVNKAPAAAKALQTQIGAATQEFTKLTTEAAKAGAIMESDFKIKIYQSSQSVNDLTQKIIAQKAVVKDTEADVKRLGEAYRTALKNSPMSASVKLADYTSAKKALDEDKASLFGLTQEQANARLSVKKLRDEYALYRDESRDTVQINDGIGISLKKAFAVIGGVAAGKKLISDMIRVRGEFQAADTAIQTLLGSKEKADALMVKVKEYAKISPLEFSDVTASTKMMLGFNIEAEKVPRYLQAIGDISMGEASKFNSLTLAFSQMSATGKLMGQDLNQMINAGFNPLQQIATSTGKSIAVLKEEMSKGAISAEMVQQAFIDATSAGGKFFGMSENAFKTINGQLSMMQDAIDSSLNEMGKKSEGIIMGSIHLTTKLVENYETVGRVIAGLVATYGTYRTALILNTVLEQGFNKAIWAKVTATKAATIAQATYNKVVMMNPWVAAGAAIVSLGIAMWTLADHTTSAERAQERFNKKVDDAAKAAETHKRELEELISELQNEVTAETRKMEILDEIKKGYPSLFQKFIDEKGHVKDLTEAWKAYNEETSKNKAIQNKDYVLELKKNVSDMKRIQDVFDKYGYDFKSYTKEDIALYEKYKPYDSSLKNKIEDNERELWKWEKEVREDEFTQWKVDLKGKTNEQIKAIRDAMVERSKSAKGDNALLSALGKRITAVDNEIESRKAGNTTYEDEYNKAKKEWDTAKIALSDIEKDRSKFNVEQYEKAKELKETTEKRFKDLGGVTGASLTNQESAAEKLRKQNDKVSDIEEKNARERIRRTEDVWNQLWQGYIDLMDEGGDKTLAQMELNHEKELQAIDREKEDLIEKYKEAAKAEFDAKENAKKIENPQYKTKSFNGSGISLSSIDTTQLDEKYKVALDRQSKAVKAYYELEKQALNEYLIEYGTYQQKRQAIIDNGEVKKKGKNDWEKKSIDQETKKLLAGIDDEAQRKTSIITKLFSDMSMRTVADIRLIANEAKNMLDYVNGGEFKTDSNGIGLFGITKEQFDILSKSPEKLESIKNEIANVNREADAAEAALGKMATGLKKVFSSNPVKFKEGLSNLSDGMNQLTQSGKFLSESLSSLGDSLGSGALNEIASGVDVAMDAMSSTMDGAKAGAAFGPWGAAAGAAIGMVTSLASSFAKIHDAKNEKRIQVLQGQIEVLEKTYDTLGESIEKAYSKDASRLIAQQNTLLEQQKVLIRNQIAEEEQKKKSDSGRIEDWKKQIEDINKLIGENKVKLVDAIFGEDIKSAIDNFAQSYGDAWSSNENKVKSSKNAVKDMMRQMVTESIKAAIQSSKSMEQIRSKLQEFYADNILSGWEQNYIYNMAEELQKELDKQFGWADSLMKDDKSSQDSTKGTFQGMSQDTGDELNGRFTALQISNEEIKNQGILQSQSLNVLSMKTDAILTVNTETRDIADETRTILANSYIELLQISENTGESAKHLKDIKSDIAEVKRNTGRI